MIHRANPDWGTHIPVLIKVLQQTNGSFLELGLGISSTPLLHALCKDQYRFLVSFDHDPVFVNMFKKYRSERHIVDLITDWKDAPIENNNWGAVLVNHKPDERRKVEIERLKDLAEFLVVHDTQPEVKDIFGYEEVFKLFKYRYDYTRDKVHTTVLSNFKEFNAR